MSNCTVCDMSIPWKAQNSYDSSHLYLPGRPLQSEEVPRSPCKPLHGAVHREVFLEHFAQRARVDRGVCCPERAFGTGDLLVTMTMERWEGRKGGERVREGGREE